MASVLENMHLEGFDLEAANGGSSNDFTWGGLWNSILQGADAATGIIGALNNNQPARTPVENIPGAYTGNAQTVGTVTATDGGTMKIAMIGGVALVGIIAAVLILKK